VLLERTHSNRWVARARRDRPVVGSITFLESRPRRVVFRSQVFGGGADGRLLLRDAECLEVAFALILAQLARAEGELKGMPIHSRALRPVGAMTFDGREGVDW